MGWCELCPNDGPGNCSKTAMKKADCLYLVGRSSGYTPDETRWYPIDTAPRYDETINLWAVQADGEAHRLHGFHWDEQYGWRSEFSIVGPEFTVTHWQPIKETKEVRAWRQTKPGSI